MEKSAFNNKLSNLKSFTLQDKVEIQSEKGMYPFSSVLQMMDILSDKAAEIYDWQNRFLPKSRVHLCCPDILDTLLAKVEKIAVGNPDDLKYKQQAEEAKHQEYSYQDNGAFDVIREINSYQDVSFKTAPKSEILSKFLADGNCRTEDFGDYATSSIEDLGKKSISDGSPIETETLAVIFEKQGKFEKAIDIYKKLIVKYPEKSSTFATRISELESKIDK